MLEEYIKGKNKKREGDKQKDHDEEGKILDKKDIGQQKNDNYNNLTQQELINEIWKIKAEIEELKNSPERQIELQKKEEKLKRLEQKLREIKANNNTIQKPKSDNDFPTSWVIGSGIVVFGGLFLAILLRKHKLRKRGIK